MTTARIDQIPTRRNYLPAGAIIRAMEQPDSGSRVDITINADVITQRLNALAPRQGVAFDGSTHAGILATEAVGAAKFLQLGRMLTYSWIGTASQQTFRQGVYAKYLSIGTGAGLAISYTQNTTTLNVLLRQADSNDGHYSINFANAIDGNQHAYSVVIDYTGADPVVTAYRDGVSLGAGTVVTAKTGSFDDTTAVNVRVGQADTATSALYRGIVNNFTIHNFAIPATTTSGVVGVAERYASGVWVQPSERHTAFANIIDATTLNGGFETAGAGGADVFANWTETVAGGSTVNRDTDEFYAGTASCRLDIVAGANANVSQAVLVAGRQYLVTFWARNSGSGQMRFDSRDPVIAGVDHWVTGTNLPALTDSWQFYSVVVPAASGGTVVRFIRSTSSGDYSIWVDAVTVTPLGSTLDLTPIGVGRVLIDRSASRNHAIVSGTVHPTYLQPAESGRIIATTNLATNQQLLALSAFDAANKYRITSWTVTSTGTPTISLGNASAGTQYVNGLTLVANTPTAVTLATSIAATANLWCNSSTTDPVTHVITYERIS
jgi:hypothetical protein